MLLEMNLKQKKKKVEEIVFVVQMVILLNHFIQMIICIILWWVLRDFQGLFKSIWSKSGRYCAKLYTQDNYIKIVL